MSADMGEPELVEVLANHRFDEARLLAYLEGKLPGVEDGLTVRQFQGGQSNPTFHVQAGGASYVLRKKPPGVLLPSAHAVEREFRVMSALAGSGVPVPPMRLLCEDPAVIGTAFFVMDYVKGRVFPDRAMPGVDAATRAETYRQMATVLARLHAVDPEAVGLGDYGRRGQYVPRQVERWTRQYRAAALPEEPAMERLIDWLSARQGQLPDETTIAHGDYRLGNLLIAPDRPEVVAVLDWELSTLGHPMADLAYCCLPWRLPPELQGLAGVEAPGLPSEADFIAAYEGAAGRRVPASFEVFVVFSLFRWAAIIAGVYRRALDGNAADRRATEAGSRFRELARCAATIAAAA